MQQSETGPLSPREVQEKEVHVDGRALLRKYSAVEKGLIGEVVVRGVGPRLPFNPCSGHTQCRTKGSLLQAWGGGGGGAGETVHFRAGPYAM